ncbi:hypothetical protein HYU21_01565 [Candidatus Woesearchaeota archaeon]|nr:hypothetical protein [Candidatus Woesearchaeota archaeon]
MDKNTWPYLAIVGIVAIVAAVVLVMNFGGNDNEDSALVVDEEGNLAGEAGKLILGDKATPGIKKLLFGRPRIASGAECSCTWVCDNGEIDSCACDTGCSCPGDDVC